MSSKKFKSGTGEVFLRTPRGKLVYVKGEQQVGVPYKASFVIETSARQGSAGIVEQALDKRLKWQAGENGTFSSSFRNKGQRLLRFRDACNALGVSAFSSAEANPNAPHWARNAVTAPTQPQEAKSPVLEQVPETSSEQ